MKIFTSFFCAIILLVGPALCEGQTGTVLNDNQIPPQIYINNGNYFLRGAGNSTLTGSDNIAAGTNALISITNGSTNVAFGENALTNLLSGHDNIGIGVGALSSAVNNNTNIGIGYNALSSISTGENDNVAIGYRSLDAAQSGASYNTAVGSGSGRNVSGATTYNDNIFLGYYSGYYGPANLTNCFIAGSHYVKMLDVYFGSGYREQDGSNAGVDYTIHGTAAGLGGTDVGGGAVIIAPGQGNGTGPGGDFILQFAPAGSTGTSPNALSEKFRFTSIGDFIYKGPNVPAHNNSTGTTGQIAWDSGWLYVCTSTNTWKRVALNVTSW